MNDYGIVFVRTSSDPNEIGGLIDEDCIESFHNEMKHWSIGNNITYIPELNYFYPDSRHEVRLKCKVIGAKSETSLLLSIK